MNERTHLGQLLRPGMQVDNITKKQRIMLNAKAARREAHVAMVHGKLKYNDGGIFTRKRREVIANIDQGTFSII